MQVTMDTLELNYYFMSNALSALPPYQWVCIWQAYAAALGATYLLPNRKRLAIPPCVHEMQ